MASFDAHLRVLAELLIVVEGTTDYAERNDLVVRALAIARMAHMEAGVRLDPSEPEWPVVYIELPTGQVSWHLPQHSKAWDGHTTEQKYARVRAFAEQQEAAHA